MPFKKGHEKFGGRKKGTINKLQAETKAILGQICHDYVTKEGKGGMLDDLKQLKSHERLRIIGGDLFKYYMATLKSVEVKEENTNGKITIIHPNAPNVSIS